MLLDGTSLVHATSDVVLALQTNASALLVPFFASGRQLTLSTRDPTASILAGIASAVGSLVAPFESWGMRGVPTRDFLWSVGAHHEPWPSPQS